MTWTPRLLSPLDYFASLVQSDRQFHLLEAAICLGQDDYPALDVQQVLSDVDALSERLARRLAADATAMHKLRLLNHFFFDELHFNGNRNHYYDPDNSYVHRVLERRVGIPVSLALVWLELARSMGLQAQGVGFPGHFLMRVALPQGQVIIDPFNGESLGRDQLQERLDNWRGQHEERADTLPLANFLQASSEREFLARMLRNLKEIHRSHQDWQRLVWIQDRLVVLLPQAWSEYRDRGLAHAELGALAPAVRDLETYLDAAGVQDDREAVAGRLASLRRGLD